MRQSLYAICIPMLLSAAPAAAETLSLHYVAYWSGVPVGEADMKINETATSHDASMHIRTTGVVGVFAQHDSMTTVQSFGGEDMLARSRAYVSKYMDKDISKEIRLAYDGDGRLIEQRVLPPEPEGKRSPVTVEQKSNVADPLTYFLQLRHALRNALKAGRKNFTLRYFDGKRLVDTPMTIAERGEMTISDSKQKVIAVTTKRQAVAGFSEKELKRLPRENELTAYFSDDDKLVPMELQLPLRLGTLTASLEE